MINEINGPSWSPEKKKNKLKILKISQKMVDFKIKTNEEIDEIMKSNANSIKAVSFNKIL